jgi:hypothetical protein
MTGKMTTTYTVFELGRMRRFQILAIHARLIQTSDTQTKNMHQVSNEALICHIMDAQESKEMVR